MVSQVWEGVSRMTALAKQTTQAFLEGSVVLGQPLPGKCFYIQFCFPCNIMGLDGHSHAHVKTDIVSSVSEDLFNATGTFP